MPLMMDDSMVDTSAMNGSALADANMMESTMDDLFGEGADGLGVSLPSIPLPAALVQRIADMQNAGCCTKLAWSNTGCVAHIPPDGRKVNLYALARNPHTESWSLSAVSKHAVSAPDHADFVHLEFSTLGQDLAIVDSFGIVHMYIFSGSLNRLLPSPSDNIAGPDARSCMDAIVGLQWLPTFPMDLKNPYISPASKLDDGWSSHIRARDQTVPKLHHPGENKNALVHVSRSGKLSLLYQQDGHGWQKVMRDIVSPGSSDELLSHAAFCDNGGTLLLVTHDCARQFRLYSVAIHWNASQANRQGGTCTVLSPALDIGHLTAVEHVAPQHSDNARLTHLRLLPAVDNALEQHDQTSSTVLACFVHASLPADINQPHQDSFTVLAPWHVETIMPTLHESFGKLKANSQPTPTTASVTVLRRQPDVVSHKTFLAMSTQAFDSIVSLASSDGTIEFRERSTMTSIEPYADTTFVSSLAQSGFEHSPGPHNLHVAMSADGSCTACVLTDGRLDSRLMALRYGWHMIEDGISDTKGMVETAIVCLAREYAILCYSSGSSDEVLALLPPDLNHDLRHMFVKEIIRTTNRPTDFSLLEAQKAQMLVLKDPILPRALSAQLVMGTKAGSTERTMTGQLAWAVLNLKHTCMTLAQSVSRPETVKPEVLHSLRGIFHYAIDFMVSIMEGVMAARRNAAQSATAKSIYEDYTAAGTNPWMHVVFCSFARTLLRFQTMYLPRYLMSVQQTVGKSRSITERQHLIEALNYAKTMPFKFQTFEQLASDVDQAIRDAFTQNDVSDKRRADIELEMLTEGTLPDEMLPVLQSLLDSTVPKIEEGVDDGKLYFWDTELLGMATTVAPRGGKRIDVVTKMPLIDGMNLRRCRRCGSEMQDIPLEKMREQPMWLISAHRHCICNAGWVLV